MAKNLVSATSLHETHDEAAYPEPSAEALEWLSGFEGLHAQESVETAPPDKPRKAKWRLIFLLDLAFPASMGLGKSRPQAGGGYSKPVVYRPHSYDLVSVRDAEHFLCDEDLLPLRLFLASQAGSSYYFNDRVELTGEIGSMLLRRALATGRLFIHDQLDAPLKPGDATSLNLTWVRNEAGLQQMAFDLPLTQHVINTWPPFYVETDDRTLGELVSEIPEDVLKHLISAPPLNDADAFLVRSKVLQLSRAQAITVPLPEAAEATQLEKPKLRLVLSNGRFVSPTKAAQLDYAVAEVHFDYGLDRDIVGIENPAPLIQHRTNGSKQVFVRDLATENAGWQQLRSVGLDHFLQRLPGHDRIDGEGGHCMMPGRMDASGWLPFLREGIKALTDAGVQVVISDAFPFRLTHADDWFVELTEEAGHDWLSLNLGVTIDGQRVSLVQPIMHLLRDQPRLLTDIRTMDDAATYPVALDERRILSIPVPRLKAWLLPLLDFLDEERPRIGRHHAAVLAGLESQPTTWIGGEALRDLGRRLRNFSGITQCKPADGFMTELRPYQQEGLDWLQFLREYGLSGILADDMGLGKTVQTLAHIHCEKVSGRADLPTLVIATTSLMSNWRNEAAQFTPSLKVLTLHGKERANLFHEIDQADIVLTTYPLLVRDRDLFLEKEFHLLVVDEAQFIKNPKAQAHQVARQIKARHRLSLTGTPLENHLGELWAQYDFLMPGFLGTNKRFTQAFRTPIEKQDDGDARARLADRVKPFLLRRTKEQVLKDLPPRVEVTRWAEISGGQRDLYESLRVLFDKQLRKALLSQGIGRSQIMILDALLKLRQVCCDPRLVNLPAADEVVKAGAGSAKLELLMEILTELIDEGRRILLFSQFTSMLALIEKELARCEIPYVKLTGQVRDRETPIREFQEGKVPLFLISLKAGGAGLNLTAADTVIHYDPWWNPAAEEQATARAHRIGQEKSVFVYKLITLGTVEEKILELQERKRGLADKLVQASGQADQVYGAEGNRITAEDLEVLFQPVV